MSMNHTRGAQDFSVPLTLADLTITALMEATDCLVGADDPETFVAALDNNLHLWRRLVILSPQQGWLIPERRLTDFILATSSNSSRRVSDSDVEALIVLNRDVASAYCASRGAEQIRRRVEAAWTLAKPATDLSFQAWLLARLGDA